MLAIGYFVLEIIFVISLNMANLLHTLQIFIVNHLENKSIEFHAALIGKTRPYMILQHQASCKLNSI